MNSSLNDYADDDLSPDTPAELNDSAATDFPAEAPGLAPLEIEVGRAMPGAARRMPVLSPDTQGYAVADEDDPGCSKLAQGMSFTGDAVLRGAVSIGGDLQGNIRQAEGAHLAVVVTETGRVRGDIVADKISVMGQTEGTLDAGSGLVALHDASTVKGHVRYGRVQVNGADLNATLERVVPAKSVS